MMPNNGPVQCLLPKYGFQTPVDSSFSLYRLFAGTHSLSLSLSLPQPHRRRRRRCHRRTRLQKGPDIDHITTEEAVGVWCLLMDKASKLLLLRRLSGAVKSSSQQIHRSCSHLLEPTSIIDFPDNSLWYPSSSLSTVSRNFCSGPSNLGHGFQAPEAIDYRSLLQEDEFHRLANSTIHDLQEKFEEYGDAVQIDGFDVDYGNEVLTLKLGTLGTYVLNKQTPNRQIWLSSPVSGPSRFDWDRDAQAWVYRRTKVNLLKVVESELEQLCAHRDEFDFNITRLQEPVMSSTT